MYTDFFGLSEKPFSVAPDPRFLYLTPAHREALASLIYGIREKMGIVCLIGEVGTGKTTLLYKLMEDLNENVATGTWRSCPPASAPKTQPTSLKTKDSKASSAS